MNDVTRILSAIEHGDPHAAHQLLPLIYGELRQLAAKRIASEQPGQTLQTTALVHEAWLRLVGNSAGLHWDHRGHFFAAAAEAMRRILIENARRKQGPRHGGHLQRVDADLNLIAADAQPVELLALDEALTRLAAESPVRAELVKLRFFAGLTVSEAAEVLGISVATVELYWTYARTWLYSAMSDPDSMASDECPPMENG